MDTDKAHGPTDIYTSLVEFKGRADSRTGVLNSERASEQGYCADLRHRTTMKAVMLTVPVARRIIGTQLRRRGGMRCISSMSISASQLSRMPAKCPAPTTATTLGALRSKRVLLATCLVLST